MPDEFDPHAMVERFRARANAVRSRGLPPVEGPERERFKQQAQADYMDFAMLGDAEADPRGRDPDAADRPAPRALTAGGSHRRASGLIRHSSSGCPPCAAPPAPRPAAPPSPAPLSPASTTSPTNRTWLGSRRDRRRSHVQVAHLRRPASRPRRRGTGGRRQPVHRLSLHGGDRAGRVQDDCVDRLHEATHQGPVLAGQHADREPVTRLDQPAGHRAPFDCDGHQLG